MAAPAPIGKLDTARDWVCRSYTLAKKAAWQKQKTHFDTNHLKTIIWDPANLEHAGEELTATIRATLRADAKETDD